MSERISGDMEAVLSPEQQGLVDVARVLLAEVKPYERTATRPTTRREKVGFALGRLFGARPEPGSRETYHRTLQLQAFVRTLKLREFQPEDARDERMEDRRHLVYTGGGAISLQQTLTLTPPNTTRTEELSLLATGRAGNALYNMSSNATTEELWRIDLLSPLDDATLARVRAELEQAVSQRPEA